MKKISDETRSEIAQLKLEGMTYKEIQEQTGVAKGTISTILTEIGLGKSKPVEITDDLLEKIQNRYNEIGNIKKVAAEFRISYTRLSKYNLNRTVIKSKSNYDHVKDRRIGNKQYLVEYKGNKCQLCGYNKCNKALEFHHIDPSTKEFSICTNLNRALEDLIIEVDKCVLLCSNCHKEVHAGVSLLN